MTVDTGKSSTYKLTVDGPLGRCGRLLAWLGMRRVPGLDTVPGEAIYRFTPADIAAARPDVVVLADEDGVRDTVRQLLPPGLRVVELSGSEQGTVAGQDGAFSVLSILSVLHSFPPMLVRAFQ